MALIDYGALVKKNGILLPYTDLFNNYSTLNGGELAEVYSEKEDEELGKYRCLEKSEYVGDESVREFPKSPYDYDYNSKRSVIHNYMAVVGDNKFLVATYKTGLATFDSEKYLFDYCLEDCKFAKVLKNDFADIKIKKLGNDFVGIASFRYNGDNYEILFGCGVDSPKFLMSKKAVGYMSAKTLRKVRRWVKRSLS